MQLLWYFAYGSNMNPRRLFNDRLTPAGVDCAERVLGRLDGWALMFDKPSAYFAGAAAANLMLRDGAHVLGTLNRLPEKGLEVLDRYENVATKQYERAAIRVLRPDTNEMVEAITYIARNNLDPALKPRADYLAHLLAGRDLLPVAYVEALASLPVCPAPISRDPSAFPPS